MPWPLEKSVVLVRFVHQYSIGASFAEHNFDSVLNFYEKRRNIMCKNPCIDCWRRQRLFCLTLSQKMEGVDFVQLVPAQIFISSDCSFDLLNSHNSLKNLFTPSDRKHECVLKPAFASFFILLESSTVIYSFVIKNCDQLITLRSFDRIN